MDALRRDVDRIIILVDGNDDLDIEGLRQRMDRIEAVAVQIGDFKHMIRGIAIGLGVTSLTGIGTLAALLSKLFGGP